MRQGWEIKKLGDIGTFQRGGGFLKSDFVEDGYPCVHYGQIHTKFGVKTYNHLTCISEELALSKSKIANSGDIIIAITSEDVEGSCKCTAWLGDYDVAVGGHAAIFKHGLNPAFVAYYFRGPYFNTAKKVYAHGSKVVEIRPADIATINISYPSLSEQEKIVAELDCLSGIIEKKKQQLKELDALAQSIFYEMFGENAEGRNKWKIAKLGNVCKTTSGGTPSKGHPEYYEGGDIPWLRSGEVNKMNIHETELFITEDGLNNSSAKWFPKGTVVIAMYGATVGQVGILCNPMTTNQAICGIFPNETFTPIYLYHFLLSKKPEYLEIATGGAQANISQNIVRDTVVSCPPLTLQQDFASKIEAIEKQKEQIAQSIKETETLFNSRMDYYFN